MAYSKAACTLVCANEPDWQNERRMIRRGYCNECTPQIVQAACQCPKSSLHPRMFALNGGLESNPTIYLPFQSVKLKPSAGCFLCVMRQTVAQQPLTPSPVGEGWGEGFSGGGRRFWSGYGGDTPCPAVKFSVRVRNFSSLRKGKSGVCRRSLQTGMNIKVQAAFEPFPKQPAL